MQADSSFNSQRNDPRWEALWYCLRIHTKGTIVGARTGRRTAGYLDGFFCVCVSGQAERKTQKQQVDHTEASWSKLHHTWAGGEGEAVRAESRCRAGGQWAHLSNSPALTPSAELRERGWVREGEREGGSCVSSWVLGNFPWIHVLCCEQKWEARMMRNDAFLCWDQKAVVMNYLLSTQRVHKR